MNVGKGDLAYIVEATLLPENLGAVVTVLEADDGHSRPGLLFWRVTSNTPFVALLPTGERVQVRVGCIPDRCLRRICPPGTDLLTETKKELHGHQ